MRKQITMKIPVIKPKCACCPISCFTQQTCQEVTMVKEASSTFHSNQVPNLPGHLLFSQMTVRVFLKIFATLVLSSLIKLRSCKALYLATPIVLHYGTSELISFMLHQGKTKQQENLLLLMSQRASS